MTSLGQSFVVKSTTTNTIAEFQHSFEIASPSIRRNLVIAAIDNGLISRGMSLNEVKLMFTQGFQVFHPKSQNEQEIRAVAFFEPAKPAPETMMSALQEGWYIDFQFTSDERLEYYSLSNLHK